MEDELKELKSVLRSLVVSSPTQVDVRSLLRDYRNMVGSQLPLAKYGYKDPITFLRERFSDCFLFQGPPANPELTLIVPEALKHVDKFVQKQKVTLKNKSKRRSVPESAIAPSPNLMTSTFKTWKQAATKNSVPVCTKTTENEKYNQNKSNNKVENNHQVFQNRDMNISATASVTCTQSALRKFLKKRSPLYNSHRNDNPDDDSNHGDDSGRQTSSTSSSTKRTQLDELKREVRDMILDHPNGVWCTDLLRLYRARHGRELNFICFGYTSVLSLASSVDGVAIVRHPPSGDWLLCDARRAPPAVPRGPCAPAAPRTRPPAPDPDDALPGIPYETDVFPADGMHFLESIPSAALEGAAPGALLEVQVAEVYSPSHFWLQRLGERHNIAMENMMDDMNRYYTNGEGRDRRLSLGAIRVGHYCSSRFDGDWHRSLIVKILDCDTVKVRHVDYGTVDRCNVSELRVLRREWAALEAQAVRARLAGVRPPAAGRRWPRSAAQAFLGLVRDRRLVASVVGADPQDAALEVFLVDTATDDDVCVGDELVRTGHADRRPDSALGTSECYLYPRFDALESGATPNYAEIHAYLRDGIQLEFVEDYRRHVPPGLPPLSPEPRRRPAPRDSCDRSPEPDDSQDRSSEPDDSQDRASEPHDSQDRASEPGRSRDRFFDPDDVEDAAAASFDNRVPLFASEQLSPSHRAPPPPPAAPARPCARLAPRTATPPPAPQTPPPAPTQPLPQPQPQPPPQPQLQLPPQPQLPLQHQPQPQPAFLPPRSYYEAPYAAPVSLSASQVEAFALLSRVDLVAAHRFMVDAVSRALCAPRYWPAASLEGGPSPSTSSSQPFVRYPTLADYRRAIRPPPGFENFI